MKLTKLLAGVAGTLALVGVAVAQPQGMGLQRWEDTVVAITWARR
jgi:hypothetical protein